MEIISLGEEGLLRPFVPYDAVCDARSDLDENEHFGCGSMLRIEAEDLKRHIVDGPEKESWRQRVVFECAACGQTSEVPPSKWPGDISKLPRWLTPTQRRNGYNYSNYNNIDPY